ncbi:MAG: VCBS repeat-containing protein [Clostridia bacterium]|nr:VCBS repeat-containing protein [Clostridia bacterium]
MKRIKIISFILILALLLSGCSLPGGETGLMLIPPTMSSRREALTKAIKAAVGESYELVYPQEGSYRTGIVSKDLDGDDKTEAICFYRPTSAGAKLGFLVMKNNEDGSWSQVAKSVSAAASVGKVEFGDLNADGIYEIIVGWQYLSDADGSYEIFSIDKGKAVSHHTGLYSSFILMGSQPERLLVLNRNTATKAVTASLVGQTKDTFGVINTVAMNDRSTDFLNFISAKTTRGNPAVYVDESLESGQTTTEVLVINNQNRLTNELLNQLNSAALRYTAVPCRDTDNDGIPEVPSEEALPSYLRNGVQENLYLIQWNQFDGTNLSSKTHSFVDTTEKFIVNFPKDWYGKVTVERQADSDRAFAFKTMRGEQLFVIRVYALSEYNEELGNAGWRKLYEDSDHIYTVRCEEKNSMKIDYTDVYSLFNVI